eukprot:2012204-Amphidinium_carterae.1
MGGGSHGIRSTGKRSSTQFAHSVARETPVIVLAMPQLLACSRLACSDCYCNYSYIKPVNRVHETYKKVNIQWLAGECGA